jgi:hypothetical protein
MQKRTLVKESRRAWQRFIVLFKAEYFTEQSAVHRDCIVVEISMSGACVKLPRDKNIASGITMFLKLLTKESKPISIEGKIVWVKQAEHAIIAGIKFTKLVNINNLQH